MEESEVYNTLKITQKRGGGSVLKQDRCDYFHLLH